MNGTGYICSVCNSTFRFSGDLRRHELMQHPEYRCTMSLYCRFWSTDQDAHVFHCQQSTHQLYICSCCQRAFISTRNLQRHPCPVYAGHVELNF